MSTLKLKSAWDIVAKLEATKGGKRMMFGKVKDSVFLSQKITSIWNHENKNLVLGGGFNVSNMFYVHPYLEK